MPHATHHTQWSSGEQPSCLLDDAPWQALLALLPAARFEQARLQKAFVRARGLRHPADLLRGILASVFCLNSFRVLGSWARSIGLCGNGCRSWAKRTRQAACWLLWLLQELLQQPQQPAGRLAGALGPGPAPVATQANTPRPASQHAERVEAEDGGQDATKQICRVAQATGPHKGFLEASLLKARCWQQGQQRLPGCIIEQTGGLLSRRPLSMMGCMRHGGSRFLSNDGVIR